MSCPAHFQLVRHFDWYVYDVAGVSAVLFHRRQSKYREFCGASPSWTIQASTWVSWNFGAAVAFAKGNAPVMVSVSAERFAEFLVVKLSCEFFPGFLDRVAPPTEQNRRGQRVAVTSLLPIIEETKKAISSGNLQGRRSISEMIL